MTFLDNLDKKLTQAGAAALTITKNMTSSAKIMGEINKEKKTLDDHYRALGELYVQRKGGELPDLFSHQPSMTHSEERRTQR